MSLYVNTNVSSLNAQRQLMTSSNGLNTAFERLSSGSRINSAADDAAGLQITNRMTSQINGLNQAVRNANDGISVAQTAEGAMQETTNMLQRMRELVVQADNGINSEADLTAIHEEINEIVVEIDRIAGTTQFSGTNLLDGSYDKSFLVGANGNESERVGINIGNMTAAELLGAANAAAFDPADASASGVIANGALDVRAAGFSSEDTLTAIDAAIATVGSERATLGATQNRLQSTISNLSNISENVSGARSRIMDTDFAAETANLTKFQITQQASTSILAQANARPQAALSLL
ncbi:MAG: flagellin FliC [Firmicutes bacterium]|nr:flagellin FliC [Bacillota bacterium]